MKRSIFCILAAMAIIPMAHAASDFKCGPGYVLEKRSNIDGMTAYECKKLWCTDLENGRKMGHDNTPNSGYKTTAYPERLCDATGNCVECFGDRRWCGGDTAGMWNARYGAYTRGGADTATYQSYQKGSCFAWRLEKPSCPDGQTAVLQGNEWICATSKGSEVGSRASSVRRTGTLRRGRI